MSPVHIPLSRPEISEADIQAVESVLRSSHLSLGPKLPEFEEAMAAYVGTKHAIAVSNGTCGLHLCIRALGIHDGDEVITSSFSFVASANCMLFERAVPKFVDIEPQTYCLDPEQVERAITPKTKAILAIDVFGYMANWEALEKIAKKHNLILIEDSCEALGSARGDRMAGTFGECGIFAFYPNKQMTTGEGGIIVTNRDDIAYATRAMRNQGRAPTSQWLQHDMLGFNYRLSDINCALGTSQLKALPSFIEKRNQVVAWYAEELKDCADVSVPVQQEGVRVSWFVYVVRLADRFSEKDRDAVMDALKQQGIGNNKYFPPIHTQPLYHDLGFKRGQLPVTEHVSERTLALPFFTGLTRPEIKTVCDALKKALQNLSH